MALSILHELDHPTHPLSSEEQETLLVGAELGKVGILRHKTHPGGDFERLMAQEFFKNVYGHQGRLVGMSREFFVGHTIGMRAAMFDLSVEDIDQDGFHVAGIGEIVALREGKDIGTQSVEPEDPRFFSGMLKDTVRQVRDQGELERYPEATVIGVAIGLRYTKLSPPQGLPERVTA